MNVPSGADIRNQGEIRIPRSESGPTSRLRQFIEKLARSFGNQLRGTGKPSSPPHWPTRVHITTQRHVLVDIAQEEPNRIVAASYSPRAPSTSLDTVKRLPISIGGPSSDLDRKVGDQIQQRSRVSTVAALQVPGTPLNPVKRPGERLLRSKHYVHPPRSAKRQGANQLK